MPGTKDFSDSQRPKRPKRVGKSSMEACLLDTRPVSPYTIITCKDLGRWGFIGTLPQ